MNPVVGGSGGMVAAPGCDPLTPSCCGFPYPNNYWTVADPTTVTGLRQEQALMLRPAIRPDDAARYIVAIRNVRDGDGERVAPSPGFQALRDDLPSGDALIEARRAQSASSTSAPTASPSRTEPTRI